MIAEDGSRGGGGIMGRRQENGKYKEEEEREREGKRERDKEVEGKGRGEEAEGEGEATQCQHFIVHGLFATRAKLHRRYTATPVYMVLPCPRTAGRGMESEEGKGGGMEREGRERLRCIASTCDR